MKKLIIITGMLLATCVLAMPQEKLNSQDIADAIENEYRFDHAIDFNRINISVVDGIVELTGTVSNIAAKERAAKIAELVKGVRAVSNRIDVIPPVLISDAGIKENVEYAFMTDPATPSYGIDVAVENKIVTLSGNVDSYKEKELCEMVAKSVKGVMGLNNRIFVDYKTERPDYEIENEIKETLKWNALIDDGLINVKVKDGDVVLSGVVGSAAEKRNAYSASWVAGVKSIDNSGLEVKWWAKDENLRKNKFVSRSDKEIEDAINDAMAYDPRVLSFNVIPESNNGYVTLRGSVDNMKAKVAAEKIAEHTVGVIAVLNRIKVNGLKLPVTDHEIKADIEAALDNNAVVEPWEIDVSVYNGTVTLSGLVDSYLEKSEAAWVVSGIKGVTDINNLIAVNYPYSYYWWGRYPYYNLYLTPPSEATLITKIDDEQIKKDIESELWWSPFVDRDDVTVTVDNGNVTLTGSVDSWREYQKAAENAWEGGAWSVNNELIVE